MKKVISIFSCFIIFINYAISQNGCFFTTPVDDFGHKTRYSGDPYIDQINNREYYWLSNRFGVNPDFWYFQENEGPNCFATDEVIDDNRPDGTVMLGLKLLKNECNNSSTKTCSAVPIILAHEFAHIVAYKYKSQFNIPFEEGSVEWELFADYLAGIYMCFRVFQQAYTNVLEAAKSFFDKGGSGFHDDYSHGTAQQRYDCLDAGYKLVLNSSGSYISLEIAVRNAVTWVNQY